MEEALQRFEGELRWGGGLFNRVTWQVRKASPREACGVLLGYQKEGVVWIQEEVPAKNLAQGTGQFFLDPIAWMKAEEIGAEFLIPWHSHPGGCEFPSKEDEALFEDHALIGIAVLNDNDLLLRLWIKS